jgi:hypothetical protein
VQLVAVVTLPVVIPPFHFAAARIGSWLVRGCYCMRAFGRLRRWRASAYAGLQVGWMNSSEPVILE